MEGNLALLLLLSARWGDGASVRQLLEQAEAVGVRPSAHTMESVLTTYIKNKNLPAAVGLYADIQREYGASAIEACTVVNLCLMLMESGEPSEGVRTMRDFVESHARPDMPPKSAAEGCKALLHRVAETGSYELTKELFDLLLRGRLVDPGPQVVAPLLQCKLERDDLEGTVEVAEYIYHSFHTLPKRMEILIKIMSQHPPSDEDLLPVLRRAKEQTSQCEGVGDSLLGRMFDLALHCYGMTQAQHDLLFACLESGYPAAARLVLEALGGEVDERQVVRLCKIYAKNEREAALEHLLAASRGMTTLDRTKICEILLDAYRLAGNTTAGEKGLSLWRAMQEEGLTPSPAFLSSLAVLLASCSIEVPFQVP